MKHPTDSNNISPEVLIALNLLIDAIIEQTMKSAREVNNMFQEFHDTICSTPIDQCPDAIPLRNTILKMVGEELERKKEAENE